MSYDNHYGYDQVYIDPINGNGSSYQSYTNSLVQPTREEAMTSFSKTENFRSPNIPFIPEVEQRERMRQISQPYNDVYDYLEKNARNTRYERNMYENKFDRDQMVIDDLRKKVSEYQYKHDIFLIFIICLVVYIMTLSNKKHQSVIHYDSMMRPMQAPIHMPMPSAPMHL